MLNLLSNSKDPRLLQPKMAKSVNRSLTKLIVYIVAHADPM